jgi:hypothetical protein
MPGGPLWTESTVPFEYLCALRLSVSLTLCRWQDLRGGGGCTGSGSGSGRSIREEPGRTKEREKGVGLGMKISQLCRVERDLKLCEITVGY